jgi:hypothetical protein
MQIKLKIYNFDNIFLNSKIQEGLIDIDNTKFSLEKSCLILILQIV